MLSSYFSKVFSNILSLGLNSSKKFLMSKILILELDDDTICFDGLIAEKIFKLVNSQFLYAKVQ